MLFCLLFPAGGSLPELPAINLGWLFCTPTALRISPASPPSFESHSSLPVLCWISFLSVQGLSSLVYFPLDSGHLLSIGGSWKVLSPCLSDHVFFCPPPNQQLENSRIETTVPQQRPHSCLRACEMSHIETEPLLVNSWVGMGREMENRTGNWNLNVLSHMCYIKTVREKKTKSR